MEAFLTKLWPSRKSSGKFLLIESRKNYRTYNISKLFVKTESKRVAHSFLCTAKMNSELLTTKMLEDLQYDPFSSSNMLLNQNLDLDENFVWIGFKAKIHYTSIQMFSLEEVFWKYAVNLQYNLWSSGSFFKILFIAEAWCDESNFNRSILKDTLMKIWKSTNIFVFI